MYTLQCRVYMWSLRKLFKAQIEPKTGPYHISVHSVYLKPKSKDCDVWYDHNCWGKCLSDQFTPRRSLLSLDRITSGPHSSICLQPEQNPTMAASENYFWHLCSAHDWMIRCTRCSSFKIVCESLQTTQCRPFKRYWERGSNLASIERVSLYEQVKKSPWVLSLALFSGKMVPRAGQPNTRSTSHNALQWNCSTDTRWMNPQMLATNSRV